MATTNRQTQDKLARVIAHDRSEHPANREEEFNSFLDHLFYEGYALKLKADHSAYYHAELLTYCNEHSYEK